jgi:hypothetical protein
VEKGKEIILKKIAFSKSGYTNVIDTSFSEFTSSNPEENNDNVEELFRLYNKLFFEIPKTEGDKSHLFLINKSQDYLERGVSDNWDNNPLILRNIVKNHSGEFGTQDWIINGILRTAKYSDNVYGGDELNIDKRYLISTDFVNKTVAELRNSTRSFNQGPDASKRGIEKITLDYSYLEEGEFFFTSFSPEDKGIVTTAYQDILLDDISSWISGEKSEVNYKGKTLSVDSFLIEFFAFFGSKGTNAIKNNGVENTTVVNYYNDKILLTLYFLDENEDVINKIGIQNFVLPDIKIVDIDNNSTTNKTIVGKKYTDTSIKFTSDNVAHDNSGNFEKGNVVFYYKGINSPSVPLNRKSSNIPIYKGLITFEVETERNIIKLPKNTTKIRIEMKFFRPDNYLSDTTRSISTNNTNIYQSCLAFVDNINLKIIPIFK